MDQFLRTAAASKMVLPKVDQFHSVPLSELQRVFEAASKESVHFLLYVDPLEQASHGLLKLFEAFYKVLTQHVTSRNLEARPVTMKNILMKTNMKAFGLNYAPSFASVISKYEVDEKLLVFGYDVAHPSVRDKGAVFRQTHDPDLCSLDPSVVGFCSNTGAHSYNFCFVGDFFYQVSGFNLL